MKAILICPEHRATGGLFYRMKPLALMPVLGRSLLDHALSQLKKEGIQDVLVLASDRPEVIREALDKGRAWGLNVEVVGTLHEMAPDAAELQYGCRATGETKHRVMVVDSMPGLPGKTFWQSNDGTFEAINAAVKMPGLAAQLTMREVAPRVWVSVKALVSNAANLVGPAWIGPHASIGPGAQIGPNAIIETGAFIDGGASVENSWIGPATYVGATAAVKDSCAWGDGLLNCNDGSFVEVRDSFLLNDLTLHTAAQRRASIIERMLAALLMAVTAPLAFIPILRSRIIRQDSFNEKRVILPPPYFIDSFSRTYRLLSLNGVTGMFRRWPELWRVIRGDMALVGNRPLSPEETTALRGPMGQLWLESPAGVFSLADAEGADGEDIGESLGHSAFFTTQRTWWLRLKILCRCLGRFILSVKPAETLPARISASSL